MTTIRTFRDLVAWQRAKALALALYRATQAMPPEERFSLTLQMRRCAVSILSNIAEGYGRQSTKDYLKHLRIACGSLAELMTQYEIALDLSMLPPHDEVASLLEETDRLLQGLVRSIDRSVRR